MCSKKDPPTERDSDDKEDVDAAEALLSLNKSISSKNKSDHTDKKGNSTVTVVSTDSSDKKVVTTVRKNSDNMPAKQIVIDENEEILQDGMKKYEFSVQDYHIRKGEQQNPFLCEICGKLYGYTFSLKRHYLRTHISFVYLTSNDISNCNISQSNVKKHYEKHKAITDLKQAQQNKIEVLPSCSNDKNNGKIMLPNLFCCNVCMEMFDDKESLKHHLDICIKTNKDYKKYCSQRKSTEAMFCCQHCSKSFHDADAQRKHEETHKYCCEHCQLVFTHNKDLKRHVSIEHQESYHPCINCKKYFSTQQKLQEHLQEHSESSVTDTENSALRNNIYAEDKEQSLMLGDGNSQSKYGCTECKKRFKSYGNMRRHRRLSHNSFAGKSTRSRSIQASVDKKEAVFFENLSLNIANNLRNCIDGKNIMQVVTESSSYIETEKSKWNIPWTAYNFPVGFDLEQAKETIEYNNKTRSENNVEVRNDLDLSNQINSEMEGRSEKMSILKESYGNDSEGNKFLLDNVIQQNDCSILSNPDSLEKHALDLSSEDQLSLKKQPLIYLCKVCWSKFYSKEAIEEHKLNNHINVLCTHIELEDEAILPHLYVQNCSPVGAICQCSPLIAQDNRLLICTKCKEVFNNQADFHLHILECGSKTTDVKKCNDSYVLPSKVNKQKVDSSLARKRIMLRRRYSTRLTGYNFGCGRFSRSPFLKNSLYKKILQSKKFKHKEKGNSKNKKNSMISDSNFSEVVRSNFKKIVPDVPGLYQNKNIGLNAKNSMLDMSTKEPTIQLSSLPLKSKKTIDPKNKFSKRSTIFKENLQPLQHWCKYCRRFFAYLANYRKHMMDGCPIKKQKEECQDDDKPLDFTKQDKTVKMLSPRGQVEQSIIGLFNNQSLQSEIIGTGTHDKPQLNRFQCPICHKIFLNLCNQMSCVMTHKLHSDESSYAVADLSVTKNENMGSNFDSSEMKSKITESSFIREDLTIASAVGQISVPSQLIYNVKENKATMSSSDKKESDISQELNVQEESLSSENTIDADKVEYKKRVLCNESGLRNVHYERNGGDPDSQATPSNIRKTRSSVSPIQNTKQTPWRLRTKRNINDKPVVVPSKQSRKIQPLMKMAAKGKNTFVSENIKVSSKKKAQKKSRKCCLGRKTTPEKKCK